MFVTHFATFMPLAGDAVFLHNSWLSARRELTVFPQNVLRGLSKGKTTRKRQTKRDAIEILLLKKYWLFCTLQTYGYFQCIKVNLNLFSVLVGFHFTSQYSKLNLLHSVFIVFYSKNHAREPNKQLKVNFNMVCIIN